MSLTRYLPLMLLFTAACQTTFDLETEAARVMAIHDEVMPLMSEMARQRRVLDGLTEGMDSVQAIPYQTAIRQLRAAEDGMWDWMAEYRKPEKATPESQAYLNEQGQKIQAVSDAMRTALSEAKALSAQ